MNNENLIERAAAAGFVVRQYEDVLRVLSYRNGACWVAHTPEEIEAIIAERARKMPKGWRVDSPGHSFVRDDGARCWHAPSNSAAKSWVSNGPNGETRRRQNGRFQRVVTFLTPEAAMRAADRDWPRSQAG